MRAPFDLPSFPPHPSKLVAKKEAEQCRKRTRKTERKVEKGRIASLHYKTRERGMRKRGAFRQFKLVLLAWLYLWRRQWTVDNPPLSQLPHKPWLNNRAAFGRRRRNSPTDFLSETNTACLSGLSVQPLAASINPAPTPNLPHPITDWER